MPPRPPRARQECAGDEQCCRRGFPPSNSELDARACPCAVGIRGHGVRLADKARLLVNPHLSEPNENAVGVARSPLNRFQPCPVRAFLDSGKSSRDSMHCHRLRCSWSSQCKRVQVAGCPIWYGYGPKPAVMSPRQMIERSGPGIQRKKASQVAHPTSCGN